MKIQFAALLVLMHSSFISAQVIDSQIPTKKNIENALKVLPAGTYTGETGDSPDGKCTVTVTFDEKNDLYELHSTPMRLQKTNSRKDLE